MAGYYKLREDDGEKIKVTEIERHRNGIGGLGFTAVRFEYKGTEFIGTFDDEGRVQVINPNELRQSMRGHDYFGEAIRRAVVNDYVKRYDGDGLTRKDLLQDIPALSGA